MCNCNPPKYYDILKCLQAPIFIGCEVEIMYPSPAVRNLQDQVFRWVPVMSSMTHLKNWDKGLLWTVIGKRGIVKAKHTSAVSVRRGESVGSDQKAVSRWWVEIPGVPNGLSFPEGALKVKTVLFNLQIILIDDFDECLFKYLY